MLSPITGSHSKVMVTTAEAMRYDMMTSHSNHRLLSDSTALPIMRVVQVNPIPNLLAVSTREHICSEFTLGRSRNT